MIDIANLGSFDNYHILKSQKPIARFEILVIENGNGRIEYRVMKHEENSDVVLVKSGDCLLQDLLASNFDWDLDSNE